jgi:hypothetical protein
MTTSAIVPLSSSDVRDEIFSQHEHLRRRLTETIEIADRAERRELPLDILRAQARSLCEEVAAQMEMEERLLPAALRDVIGWGAVLQAKMSEDHQRQRVMLAAARTALEQSEASAPALSDRVRTLVSTVLFDIEAEEQGLLHADIDALAIQSQGG